MLLVHVDDVMLMGDKTYVQEIFLPLLKKKLDLSCELLKNVGDSISFLKRLYVRVGDGIVVKPGNYIQKMLEAFEERFGMVRIQQVPADGGIQVQDGSQELHGADSTTYRSVTGMALYLQRACFKDGKTHSCCTSAFEEFRGVPQRNSTLCIEAYHSSAWSWKAGPQ
jgi:hypothetical protein